MPGGVGGDREPPLHSEKWEEAMASRNAAPRPLGLRSSGLLVCHVRDLMLSRDSGRQPGSTCPLCACWGTQGQRPCPLGTDRDGHGGGGRASSQPPACAALPARREQRPGLQALLVPQTDGRQGL